MAPNAFQVLKQLGIEVSPSSRFRTKSVFTNLSKKGLIQFKKTGRGSFARLTEAGERYMARVYTADFLKTKKPKRWDKKWRIIIFDIPEYRRNVREEFRGILQDFGFYRLQNSVWIYPYDCEDIIALVKADLKVGKDILYIISDSVENDTKIRVHFGLK